MKSKLKYKTLRQYDSYAKVLEELVFKSRKSDEDEIKLLTLNTQPLGQRVDTIKLN